MTTRPISFNGERLREAREARGISATSLSELVGKSQQTISHYEKGVASPPEATVSELARALSVSETFFFARRPGKSEQNYFFRSMAATTKTSRNKAHRKGDWLSDVVEFVEEYVELPEPQFAALQEHTELHQISDDEIDDIAARVRQSWKLPPGPIANIVSLLEHKGAVVTRGPLGHESMDGLSFINDNGRLFIMIGTDKGSPVRWRWDVAHELGHVVLHSDIAPSKLKPEDYALMEKQAHRFAGAFLMPAVAFHEDFFAANLDTLKVMKLKWKVSISAIILRAKQLKLISEETERRLWINMSRRGWRKIEPYDDSMDVEEPRLLRLAIELILRETGMTSAALVQTIDVPASDITLMCSLPDSFLIDYSPISVISNPNDSVERFEGTPATIISIKDRQRRI